MCSCPGCATVLEVNIDTFHRNAARMYENNIPIPRDNMSPTDIRVHIRRLEMYIKLLDNLGIWDEKVSRAQVGSSPCGSPLTLTLCSQMLHTGNTSVQSRRVWCCAVCCSCWLACRTTHVRAKIQESTISYSGAVFRPRSETEGGI